MKYISLLACALCLTSCNTGSNYKPLVYDQGPSYENDLRHCQALSEQKSYFNSDMAFSAALGAGGGALVGGLATGSLHTAISTAALGAVIGTGTAANNTKNQKKQIIIKCLQYKGYKILA